jgi:hypothetical protein
MTISADIAFERYDIVDTNAPLNFAHPWEFNDEIEVFEDGVQQSLGADYSLVGAGLPGGGTVNPVDATIGSEWTVYRMTRTAQISVPSDPVVGLGLDRTVRAVQDVRRDVDRSLKVDVGDDPLKSIPQPILEGHALVGNATGDGFEYTTYPVDGLAVDITNLESDVEALDDALTAEALTRAAEDAILFDLVTAGGGGDLAALRAYLQIDNTNNTSDLDKPVSDAQDAINDAVAISLAAKLTAAAIGVTVQAYNSKLDSVSALSAGSMANLLELATVDPNTAGKAILAFGSKDDVSDYLQAPAYVSTRAAMKALDTTKYKAAWLMEANRGGLFVWSTGNYSTHVAADTLEGIYVKATAIAASAGCWVRVNGGWNISGFDPQWFGAVPNSGADSAPAFNAIYAMRTIFSSININLGQGIYTFNSRLVWTFTAGQHFTIQGQGWDVTQLLFVGNTGGGLYVNYEGDVRQNGSSVKVTGFSIITDQAPTTTWMGLGFNNTPFLEGMTQPGPVVRDILVRGTVSTLGPSTAFYFESCCSLVVDNCWALGKASDYTMLGFVLTGGVANRWSDHRFTGCRAYWYNTAVQMFNLGEGIVIDKGLYVAGRVGVDDIGIADRPLHLSVTNTHINADTACIRSFTGGANFFASGNLFYEWGNNTGQWNAISLADYVECTVVDNHITTWPLARVKVGIQLGNVTRAVISGNIIRGVTDPITQAIVTSGTRVIIENNHYNNCTLRTQNTATESYTCSAKGWGSVDIAFAGNTTGVAVVPHGLGIAPHPDRCLASGRFASGSGTLTIHHFGVPDATNLPVAYSITGFVSAGNIRINVKCEKE